MPVPVDLSKLSDDVVKKTVYDKLVAKVNNVDISRFVLKSKCDSDKPDLERKISDTTKKIPNTSELVKKIDHSSKISKIESKIPSVSGLVTTSALQLQ